jgi:hypothetical protein
MKKFVFIALLLTVSIVLVAQYKKHTVVKGDCLWDIAGFYYNDPFLWPVIYEANKDSIADPHWIYPGEIFVIPNVPEEQVAIPPVQEGIVMEIKGTKSKIEEEMQMARDSRLEEDLKEVEETELFSVVQAEDYAFTRKAALLAGFITRDATLELGTVSKLIKNLPYLKGSSTVMADEVEVDKGTTDGINDGDIYIIFDWDKRVGLHGRVVRIKGILKIMETGEDLSKAIVTESYEDIEKGDHIMKYTAPEVVTGEAQPVTTEVTGKIIAFKNEEPIMKPFSVVYIEPGNISVKLGDVFLIYKDGPGDLITPLGKIQIVDVRDETASGYITSIMGKTEISLGNKIRLVGRIGG